MELYIYIQACIYVVYNATVDIFIIILIFLIIPPFTQSFLETIR